MGNSAIKQLIVKHAVSICVAISVVLMLVAAAVYPGGSLANSHSVGFDWSKNFISNLFLAKAINGLDNPSRPWAVIGMAFHAVGYGIFFINMSKKIPAKHAAGVLKVVGFTNMLFTFLVATPLHDIMVTISSTLSLLGLFYITVYIFRTRLQVFKFCCSVCLLAYYYTLYLFGSGDWGLLAVMQKVSFISSILLILGLEYFTGLEDFKQVKLKEQKIRVTNR